MTKLRTYPANPTRSTVDDVVAQAHSVREFSPSLDEQDEEASIELILRIPCANLLSDSLYYRFSDPIRAGQGSFGLVFSCEDREQNGQRVAVKILRPSRRKDLVARERFQGEARVMAELRHPNILAVFGSGEIDQVPYMIAELADAGSIALGLLDSPNGITPRQAAWIVLRIALALKDAHANLILHRDVKPGNILLRTESPERSEGLGVWPLLTDFGLAKNLDAKTASPLTFEGQVLGTLAYMSPEQVRGLPLKTQSDLFPMGIILHELAYGQHPFRGADDFQTRSNIVNANPLRSSDRSRRVPRPLAAIIAKCLRKKADERYLHASDLAQDLENYLHAKPISVSPPNPWQSFLSWMVAHPIASTCLATIVCCALGSILIFNREWQVQRDLARESQMVAEDHAKMSKLFLESMRATNSDINDSILAGQRVMPSNLLQTLEHQIPLLEEALSLAPNDHMLMRQLEIMYHYQSLCYSFVLDAASKNDLESYHPKAVRARQKSLDYIEMLITNFPNEQKLRISQINGQYFMSMLKKSVGDSIQQREWMNRVITNAEKFLAKYPLQLDVLETTNTMRLERCSFLMEESPEDCVRELGQIIEINRSILEKEPSRKTLLTYSALALAWQSCILLRIDRDAEASSAFGKLEALADEDPSVLQSHWHLVDYIVGGTVDYCDALAKKRYFRHMLPVIERWQQRFTNEFIPDYVVVRGHRYSGPEFGVLFPVYYKWLALSEMDPQSHEAIQTCEELRKAILVCRARSEADLEFFVRNIQDIDRREALNRFMRESFTAAALASDG